MTTSDEFVNSLTDDTNCKPCLIYEVHQLKKAAFMDRCLANIAALSLACTGAFSIGAVGTYGLHLMASGSGEITKAEYFANATKFNTGVAILSFSGLLGTGFAAVVLNVACGSDD
jgi:hypothetical protein